MVPALEKLGLRPGLTRAPLLEPACGTGAILRVLREAWHDAPMRGFELDADRAQAARNDGGFDVTTRDALSPEPWAPAGLAMTNPPFSLALEFAERGIAERLNTLLLLRLNFLGAEGRVAFHRAHPAHIFSLGRRPIFGLNKHGKPGTDSCEYGWFGWGPAFTPNRWEPLDLSLVPAHARTWERRRRAGAKAA
ncbi:MAG: hypothetical protein MUF34_38010 [Polyangiaceae bacterium]|nr:hypothetical protein [Polyangiaceae bacterium]